MITRQELNEIKDRIEQEIVTYEDLAVLESHKQMVLNTGDVRLCEYAGITEEEFNNGRLNPDLVFEESCIRVEVEDDHEGSVFTSIVLDDEQRLTLTEHELEGLKKILTYNYNDIKDFIEQVTK